MYRLLAMDLDGTLLGKGSIMPECNVQYIKKAREAGVHVVICSGRSINPLEYFCGLAGMSGAGCYAIGFNGGIVFENDGRRILRDIRLEPGLTSRATKIIEEYNVEMISYALGRLFTVNITDKLRLYSKKSMTPIELVRSFTEVGEGLSKILAIGENAELLRLQRSMRDSFTPDECNMFLTAPTLYEVTAIGADKGSGLKFLAEQLGIGMDEVIAMGDYYNDIQMLQIAGLGVAVANAEPDVKAVAGYVTEADNSQGAVKEVIERFIL